MAYGPEFHVLPTNDLRDHVESRDCWCNPRIEGEPPVIIHNSLDGRELIERGERMKQ